MASNEKGKRKICIIKMTKRLLLLTYLIVYCGTLSIAQNKKVEFEKLVDYVNTCYIRSYVDKKIVEDKSGYFKSYKTDYSKRIKPKWDRAIKNKKGIVSKDLLKDLGNHEIAIQLFNIINKKKNRFNNDWTKDEIVQCLLELPKDKPNNKNNGFFGFLKDETHQLKKDLENHQIINKYFGTNQEIVGKSSEKNEPEKKVGEVTSTTPIASKVNRENSGANNAKDGENNGDSKFPLGIIIIVVSLAVLGYFGYKKRRIVKKILNRFKSKKTISEKDNVNDYQNELKIIKLENARLLSFVQDNARLHAKVKQLEQQIRELEKQKPQKIESAIEQTQNLKVSTLENEKKHVTNSPVYLFADAIIDGEFFRLNEKPNQDTVFELMRTSSKRTATFGVFQEAYKRVIKNPDFVDGCEKQKINLLPQKLEVENGEAAQDDFGKWKVTKKAIIKFV